MTDATYIMKAKVADDGAGGYKFDVFLERFVGHLSDADILAEISGVNTPNPSTTGPFDFMVDQGDRAKFVFNLETDNWAFSEDPLQPAFRIVSPTPRPNEFCPPVFFNPGDASTFFIWYLNRDRALYKYELNICITQETNGQKMVTKVTIDPGGGGLGCNAPPC